MGASSRRALAAPPQHFERAGAHRFAGRHAHQPNQRHLLRHAPGRPRWRRQTPKPSVPRAHRPAARAPGHGFSSIARLRFVRTRDTQALGTRPPSTATVRPRGRRTFWAPRPDAPGGPARFPRRQRPSGTAQDWQQPTHQGLSFDLRRWRKRTGPAQSGRAGGANVREQIEMAVDFETEIAEVARRAQRRRPAGVVSTHAPRACGDHSHYREAITPGQG